MASQYKYLLFVLLFCGYFISIKAQSTATNYTLETDESGSIKNYVARDSIVLKTGFQYTATSSYNFKAKIDRGLLFPPTEDKYLASDGTITSDSTQGVVVGSIPEKFDVSSTGAAVYSIPIDVAKGINGMQPSISITYNSQSGNGLVGWGTNLSGFSVITRAPKDIYHDGVAAAMTHLADDAYYLDGQRLIYDSGNPGQDSAIYYLESDPFTKVIFRGIYNDSVATAWFEVHTSNGMVCYYGKTSDAEQTYTYNSSPRINAWYINYMEDASGNYMEYTYNHSFHYLVMPSAIIYGKNKNQTDSFKNSVTFDFVYRSNDIQTNVLEENVKELVDYRLNKITCYTGSKILHTYYMTYDVSSDASDTKFSRLTRVKERNNAGDSINSTVLSWSYLPTFTQSATSIEIDTVSQSPDMTFASNPQFTSGDLTGDGIPELVEIVPEKLGTTNSYTSKTYLYVYKGSLNSDGNIQYTDGVSNKYDIMTFAYDGKWYSRNYSPSIGDFNGDGINDLLLPYFYNDYGSKLNVFKFVGGVLNDLNYSFSTNLSEMPPYTTGDFDNNGKTNIVIVDREDSSGYYPCRILSVGSDNESITSVRVNFTLSSEPEDVFASDFNSDGLTDLMVFYDGGYSIFWNQGNGVSSSTFSDSKKTTGTNIGDVKMIREGDFNGDGLPDFLLNDTNESNWDFALNNGNGTFTESTACTLGVYDQSTSDDDDKFTCFVYDFDHDGKTDVLINKTMYSSPTLTTTLWLRSTGSSLSQVKSASSYKESDGYAYRYLLNDFNGDGQFELLNYGYMCYGSYYANVDPSWRLYENPNFSVQSGKLGGVINGFKSSASFVYSSLIGNAELVGTSIYTKGSGSSYPMVDYTLPIHVVDVFYKDYGPWSKTFYYTYKGLKAHLQGKGLLGMQSKTITNKISKTVTETGINTWNTSFFIPSQTYTKTTIDGDLAESIVNMTVLDKDDKKYFAYPSSKIDNDLDGNTTTTTYAFNTDYGYPISENVDYGDGIYKKTEYQDYVLAGGAYLPRLVINTQKHSDDDDSFSQKTYITYDLNTGLKTQVISNYGSSLPITSSYTYDCFGNQLSSVSSGSGITPITKYTDYDDTHRFPAKQYTSPASTVNTFTYDSYGDVLTESDETNPDSILTTTHTYDNWGFQTKTISPLGIETAYAKGWGDIIDQRYYIWKQTAGEPWTKTWYDSEGDEVLKESIGAKDLSIQTITTYNNKLQVEEKETETGDLSITEDYTYDGRGRLATQSNSTGESSTYSYGNRTTTTVTNGRTYIKTYDALGNLKSSIDPVDTVSYKYTSSGNPKSVTSANATFSMTYDDVGNQKTLTDPNAGTTTYTYDAAGRITKRVDGRGIVTQNVYDALGRIDSVTVDSLTTIYTYGTSGNEALCLVKKEVDGNYTEYTHDKYGRVTTETQQVNGASALSFGYSYNSLGLVSQISYPDDLTVSYTYDSYGNKVKTKVGSQPIWELTGLTGLVTTSKLGGTLTSTETHDATTGLLSNLTMNNSSQVLHNMTFVFDGTTGNLTSRSGMLSQVETFAYDELDRLTDVTVGSSNTMHLDYKANGNISTKTGIGDYTYGSRPHAVTGVENTDGLISDSTQITNFNGFGKIQSISEKGYQLDFTYGPDQKRWKTVLKQNGNTVKTTIFAGDYEQTTAGGETQRLYYLDGGAIYVKQDGQSDKIYYACTDNLGSVVKLVDGDGTEVFAATYDAWGKQTITDSTFAYYRGYTGHEHLPEFDLINMNGRLYDPELGRFLSCDPFVQMPDFSQNFNRYSYCLNNPLKYNDPSGELFGIDDAILIMAVMTAMQQGVQAGAQSAMNGGSFWSGAWKGAAIGAATSLIPYGVGQLYGHAIGALGTELLRAGTHGVANGLLNMAEGGKFGTGFLTGSLASLAGSGGQKLGFSTLGVIGSTTAAGALASGLSGGDWMSGAMQGMSIGTFNHGWKKLSDGTMAYELDEVNVTAKSPRMPIVWISQFDPRVPNFGNTACKRACYMMVPYALRGMNNGYSVAREQGRSFILTQDATDGYQYLDNQLTNGSRVIVGVGRDAPGYWGRNLNGDFTTDHFVVVDKAVNNGYHFLDPGATKVGLGTSPNNVFKLNNGLYTGYSYGKYPMTITWVGINR